jgi:hypothetical protein
VAQPDRPSSVNYGESGAYYSYDAAGRVSPITSFDGNGLRPAYYSYTPTTLPG